MSEVPKTTQVAPEPAPKGADCFATTRWTVVLTAGACDSTTAQRALGELCSTYWYPVYAYVRHRGHSREDAEDLTQDFFAQLLKKRKALKRRSAEHGKFRAYLLACLKNFLVNEYDRANRLKRGKDVPHIPLDWETADTRYHLDIADSLSPDKLYDRSWAVALLERVVEALEDEAKDRGKLGQFRTLRPYLMARAPSNGYRSIAQQLEMTEQAARVVVHRLRRRYREKLREELAQTLSQPEDIEEEMRALFLAFTP